MLNTLVLSPGPLGITVDTNTGQITKLHLATQRIFRDLSPVDDHFIHSIDGEPFSNDLFERKKNGFGSYQIVIDLKPKSIENGGGKMNEAERSLGHIMAEGIELDFAPDIAINIGDNQPILPVFWYDISARERSAMSEKVREPRPPVSELVPILMDLSNGFSLEISRPDMETFCKWWILIGEERYAERDVIVEQEIALQREIDTLIIQVEQGNWEMLDLYEQKRAEKESLHMVLLDLPPIDAPSQARSPFRALTPVVFDSSYNDANIDPYESNIRRPSDPTNIHTLSRFNTSSSLINVLARAVDDGTYKCLICHCDYPRNEGIRFTCGAHYVCADCMQTWLHMKIRENCTNFSCLECHHPLEEYEIRQIIDEEHWVKFLRFKKMMKMPEFRECSYPECDAGQKGDPANPIYKCRKCDKEQCYLHASAHVGKTCKQWEKENAKDFAATKKLIASHGTRPCPNKSCGILINKSEGCNHMECPTCKTNFCYLCGAVVEKAATPRHFKLGQCNQYGDVSNDPLMLWYRWFWELTLMRMLTKFVIDPIVLLIAAPIAFGIWFVMCVLCHFWLHRSEMVMFFAELYIPLVLMFLHFILKLPFRIVGRIIWTPMWIIYNLLAKLITCCTSDYLSYYIWAMNRDDSLPHCITQTIVATFLIICMPIAFVYFLGGLACLCGLFVLACVCSPVLMFCQDGVEYIFENMGELCASSIMFLAACPVMLALAIPMGIIFCLVNLLLLPFYFCGCFKEDEHWPMHPFRGDGRYVEEAGREWTGQV